MDIKKVTLIIVGATVIVVALIGAAFFIASKNSGSDLVVESTHTASPLSVESDITCAYPQTVSGNYQGRTVTHEIPPQENQAFIFTFSGIQGEEPTLKALDSTQTISETSLIKMFEDDERVVFLEGNGNAYFALHTIHKDSSVALFSKQVSLIGIPFTTMAVGTCRNS